MNENSRLRAAKSITWGIINKLVLTLLPFFARTAMIYTIGSEYLGLNSVFTSILQILSFAELGFGDVMVYSMYKPIAEENHIKICALLNLYKRLYRVIGLIVLIIGIALLPFLKTFVHGSYPADVNLYTLYGIYLFNNVISYWLFTYKSSLLSAHQMYYVSSKIQTLSSSIMYIGEILTLILFGNYYIYVLMIPICTILNNLLIAYRVKKIFPEYKEFGSVDKETATDIKKNVLSGIGHKLGPSATTSIDNLVVSSTLGLILASVYNNYNYILTMVTSVLNIVFNSFIAGIGKSIVTESVEKNYHDFKLFTFFNNILAGWCSIFLLCLTQNFMWLWVGARNGNNYMYSNFTLYLLVVMFYCQQIRTIVITYKSAAGMWYADRLKPYFAAGFNLIFDIVLIKYMGLSGIILSTIVSRVAIGLPWETYAMFHQYFKRSTKEYYINLLYYAAVNIVIALVTLGCCNRISGYTWNSLILRFIICIVIPGASYIIFYKNNVYMKKIVAYTRQKICHHKER